MFLGPPDPSSSELSGKDLLKTLTGFRAAEDLASSFTSALGIVSEIDKEFAKVVSKMGVGDTMTQAIKKNLAEGAFEALKLGGSFEDAEKIQQNFLDTYGRNVVLQGKLTGDILATSKVTGVAGDALMSSFANAGMSAKDITKEMSTVVDVSNSLGVNAQAVSSKVTGNLEKLNRYGFTNGVEGLAKMAARATTLRVDMDTTFNLAEKLYSPESAIELASSLQRLGAASTELTDPLRLMDLAQNNVPELQNQLGEMFKTYTYFDEKTKKFQIMPNARRQLREISTELNIPIDQIEKFAFGTADLDKKLSEISFGGLDIGEDTKEMIANMATLGEGGEYEITTKNGDVQTLDKFLQSYQGKEDELKKYFKDQEAEAAKTPEEKMREIATSQLGKLGEIEASSKALAAAFGLSVEKSGAGDKLLEAAKSEYTSQADTLMKAIGPDSEIVKGLSNIGKDIPQLIEKLTSGDFMGALDMLKTSGGIAVDSINTAVDTVLQGIGDKYGVNLTDLKNNIVDTIKGGFGTATTALSTFTDAINGTKSVWESITGFLKENLPIFTEDMYLDPKSQTFIQTDFGKIIPDVNDAVLAAPKTQINSILEGNSPTSSAMASVGGNFNHTFTVNVTGLSGTNNQELETKLVQMLTVNNTVQRAVEQSMKNVNFGLNQA